jgi:hypothetical protein
MDLSWLNNRKAELEKALANIGNQYHAITGHLGEVNFMITEAMKIAAEVKDTVVETIEADTAVPEHEAPVE